jgi:hypothetical protein
MTLLKQAVVAVAAGRVALGVAALARPAALGRPWVGPVADEPGGHVLARALGARDLALGLGALNAARQAGTAPQAAAAWYAAAALADALDTAVTVAAWSRLPRVTRWLVAASAAGAAVAGAAGAVAILRE